MRTITGLEELKAAEGETLGTSDWHEVTQKDVDTFADVTGDHQWIHVDVDRAKETPFGGTIAHGYLTLSLGPALNNQVFKLEGFAFALNYGLNKVRFPAPVPDPVARSAPRRRSRRSPTSRAAPRSSSRSPSSARAPRSRSASPRPSCASTRARAGRRARRRRRTRRGTCRPRSPRSGTRRGARVTSPTSVQRPSRSTCTTPRDPPPITVPRSTPTAPAARNRERARRDRRAAGRVGARRVGGRLLAADRREVRPRVEQAELAPAASRRRSVVVPREPTTSAAMIRGDAPRLVTRMPLNEPLHEPAELARGGRHRQLRRPAVARRDAVELVLDRLQPRLRLVAQRRVLDVLGLAAGGREEVGDDRLAVVGHDLPARGGHRRVGRGGLDPDALVDLRARVGVVVEVGALGGRDRVRAGRDRLRLAAPRPATRRATRPGRRPAGSRPAPPTLIDRDALEDRRRELEHAAVGADAAERGHATVARRPAAAR